MIILMILLAVSMGLAYCSQEKILVYSITKKRNFDIPLVLMIVILSLYTGLRIDYNDTSLYISIFETSPTLGEFLKDDIKIMDNPLFYGFTCFFRHSISANPHLYLTTIAAFTIGSIICFIKKFTDNFPFSILLFFSIGLYVSTMASMKQCLAIAVLTHALRFLLKKPDLHRFTLKTSVIAL